MPNNLNPSLIALSLIVCGACAKSSTSALSPANSAVTSTATVSASAPTTSGVVANLKAIPAVCSINQSADVTVTVDTTKGPLGGAPAPFTNALLSMNIDDQVYAPYHPSLDANYVAMLAALKPAYLRWPAGYYSQTYQFTTSGGGAGALTPAFIDSFMALCKAVGAKPLFGVNIAGTTANAAELVNYLNIQKKYNVTWFQIGNEPDVNGLTATNTPAQYAQTFLQFKSAMQAVDPCIKLVGAELMSGAEVLGQGGMPDWMTPILQGTQSAPMDAIDWHYYPLDSSQANPNSSATPSVAHLLQESSPDWPPAGLDYAKQIFSSLRTLRATYAPKAQLWVDEFAEDSGKANGLGTSDRLVGALWAADALGRFAEQGVDAVFHFIFEDDAEHGYTLIDPAYVPRPEYYTYWLYAQQFGDQLVNSDSTQVAKVAVHAALNSGDKSLRVFLVNKDSVQHAVRLTLNGYAPKRAGNFVLTGNSDPLAKTALLNNQALSPAIIRQGVQAIAVNATDQACQDNVMTLPAYSATMIVLANQ